MKEYIDILFTFSKVGLFTFGGGYAMIPIVERELIAKKGWTTMDDVMEYYTISQITPGLIGVNLSTFVGYKLKGVIGGILGTMGYVLPGAVLITIAALFISNFADIPEVAHAFTGVRIAVGALILDTVIKMVKGVFKDIKALAIYLIVFALSVLPSGVLPALVKSPVTLVLASGLVGLFIFRPKSPVPDERSGPGSEKEGT